MNKTDCLFQEVDLVKTEFVNLELELWDVFEKPEVI